MITLNIHLPSSEVLSEFFNPEAHADSAYEYVRKQRNMDSLLINAMSGIVVNPNQSF